MMRWPLEKILYYGGIGLVVLSLVLLVALLLIFRNKKKKLNAALDEEYGIWSD